MSKTAEQIKREIKKYQKAVAAGGAGSWVTKAIERHVHDLLRADDFPFHFDEAAAIHAVQFFDLLKHSKGEWAGQRFELAPWQAFVTWCLFGWKQSDGSRRYRTAYVSVARKNGKTTWAAGIGLYMLLADAEAGAEVYSAATKRDQARITHGEAVRMVKSSPALMKHINTFKDNLSVDNTHSKYEPLASDYNSLDGLNISCCVCDELHAWKSRDLWDVLDTSTAARRQPLIFAITTAGHDRNSICWEQHQYSQKVLDGTVNDETFFAFIAAIDEGDDWMDEANWHKANPNLGISCKIDDLRRKAARAKETPAALNAFLRLHLGIWTEAETVWLPTGLIEAGEGKTDLDELAGRPCWAGLDLAATRDLSALVLAFRADDGSYDLVPYCWAPRDGARQREHEDRVPYLTWAREGYLNLTEGNVTDYSHILAEVMDLAERYEIQQIAFDRFGAAHVVTSLQDAELPVMQWGQGMLSMSPPTKEVERLFASGQVRYPTHPVMKWCFSNVVIELDAAGNIKPNKRKSNERIDLAVAAIMAVGASMMSPAEDQSVYADRGFLTV